jgi:ectoine hydroxylase-related dioxygenase (phytanoyl-CoA dioxygenase family)
MSHVAPDAGERFGWEGMKDVPPFVEGDKHYDPTTAGWKRRRDDPNVVARMEHLQANAGIKGLEICEPHELDRIVRIFLRDGFCAVNGVIDGERLPKVQAACTALIAERVAETPDGVTRGVNPQTGKEFTIRQPGRYSFGSHGNLHRKEWCMLADLPLLQPILEAIFQSEDYMCWGAGGDFCLPGTIEYQHLHRDCGEDMFTDPSGKIRLWDLPPPMVTCNFPMVDFNALNGPIRQIPGTQNTYDQPPQLPDEPEWMKLSTVTPLKAGGVIIRDLRAWHGGASSDIISGLISLLYW